MDQPVPQPPTSGSVRRTPWLLVSSLVVVVGLGIGVGVVYTVPSLHSAVFSTFQPILSPVSVDDSNVTPAGIAAVGSANNQFGVDMFAQLRSESGNIFFSPLSISEALGMVYEGAKGQTAAEIQSVFHFPTDDTERRSSFAAIYKQLNTPNPAYQFSVANALWAQKDYVFLPTYTQAVQKYYGGEARSVDFAGALENARTTINGWVSTKTHDKIPQLFSPGTLDSHTRLVLTDAVYFKGSWDVAFDSRQTQPTDFHVDPTHTVQAQLMHKTDTFGYAETSTLQALSLPYKGGKLSMLVLLPKSADLQSLEQSLSISEIQHMQQSLVKQKVEVFVPKFTFSTSYMLRPTLTTMGMPTAFDSSIADLSGMDGSHNLYIGDVIHKAYVAVDEQGTEAAAATGVGAMTSAAHVRDFEQLPVFRADHPFLFLIQDDTTGNILFMGRVSDPTQE